MHRRAGLFLLVALVVFVGACTRESTGLALSPARGTSSRVPDDDAVFDGAFLTSVTEGGPGFVTVGRTENPSGPPIPAIWTSSEGLRWSRVPHDDATFGRGAVADVTVGGPGLVAVGLSDGEGGVDGVVWTSPDGFTWSRVPHDQAVFGGTSINSVTEGGPGLVAVGVTHNGGLPRDNAVVWTSTDGLTWSRVAHDHAVFGEATMWRVTQAGPGLVAVGFSAIKGAPTNNAVVWTSRDGFTWSRVPHDDPTFAEASMFDVIAGGPGVVAVGWDESRAQGADAAVWTSTDGLEWSRVEGDEAVFGGVLHREVMGVIWFGSDLVVVGQTTEGGLGSVLTMWTSPDGFTWTLMPNNDQSVFGALAVNDVTTGGPGLIVVGGGVEEGLVGAVWAYKSDG